MKVGKSISLIIMLGLIWGLKAQNIFYKGNNKLNNFSVNFSNTSDTIVTLSFQQGQEFEPNNDKYSNFVFAKSYTFVVAPQSVCNETIIAYATLNNALPDSSLDFTLTGKIRQDLLPELRSLENSKIWGNKAQIRIWNLVSNTKLNEQSKFIYTYNHKHIFESNKERGLFVLAFVDTVQVDTLLYKMTKEGVYTLNLNKNVLSDIKGEAEYRIVSDLGEVLYQSGEKIKLKDTMSCVYVFNYNSSKKYSKTKLNVYTIDGELIANLFTDKKLVFGSNEQTYVFDFYGDEDEKFITKLFTSKGEIIEENVISYKHMLSQSVGKSIGERYFLIKEKYTSKRSELRTKCTIEDEEGNVLAVVFEGKNIHSGINKIDYKFKNQLNDGDEVYLYVRTVSGKLISKSTLTVYNK